MEKEGIVTSSILENVKDLGPKAEVYIKDHEPALWEWMIDNAANTARIIQGLVQGNAKPRDGIMEQLMRFGTQMFMTEVLARDMMDGREDKELDTLVKASYEKAAETMRRIVGANTPILESKFDEAVKKATEE